MAKVGELGLGCGWPSVKSPVAGQMRANDLKLAREGSTLSSSSSSSSSNSRLVVVVVVVVLLLLLLVVVVTVL